MAMKLRGPQLDLVQKREREKKRDLLRKTAIAVQRDTNLVHYMLTHRKRSPKPQTNIEPDPEVVARLDRRAEEIAAQFASIAPRNAFKAIADRLSKLPPPPKIKATKPDTNKE